MKKTNKLLAQILALMLSVGSVASLGACGNSYQLGEQIDPNRTQLYVFNFAGGFGVDWLKSVKSRYEELHKNDKYEEGKEGIQIYITNEKQAASELMSKILDDREEVYFTEGGSYYALKNAGVLKDITTAVTGVSAYESVTVESKLTAEQQAFYGIEEGGKKHYYALPHYAAYYGLTYNIDLFEDKDYYFAADTSEYEISGNVEDLFVSNLNPGKSVGIDGIPNTTDDGLPTTYEEFFILCDRIKGDGNIPLLWTGHNYKDYITAFMNSLVTDYEGLDNMMKHYTYEGTVDNLGTIVNGEFVKDAQPTRITPSNGYELARQESKYLALEFIRKMITTDGYSGRLCFNSSYWHYDAENTFLKAGVYEKTTPAAMLLDGVWWQEEARATFNEMIDAKGDNYSQKNRRFGFMPLPKANQEKVDEARTEKLSQTLYNAQNSIAFVKKNIADWKLPIALDFMQFVNTQASLVEFTTITGTTKALNYSLSTDEKNALSPYGRSVLELQEKSEVVYPFSNKPIFVNNASHFSTTALYKISESQLYPAEGFHDYKSMTAAQWFTNMYNYNKNTRWGLLTY